MSLTSEIAQTILDGFDKHYRLFRETSAAARDRFERADWAAAREAGVARIEMYDQRVREAVATIVARHPAAKQNESLWPRIKLAYIGLLYRHRQPECAETFFNSVACRVLDRRYYDNQYIFFRPAVSTEYIDGTEPTYRCYYPRDGDLRDAFERLLRDFRLKNPFVDLAHDLDCVTRALREQVPGGSERHFDFQVQVLASLFYRNKGAYAVGRIVNGTDVLPFVLAILRDGEGRLFVDTVLLDRQLIAGVLSLGRAYFMVDMEVPGAYVEFLESLLPGRPKAEFYTMLGLQKQGKTLVYRDLQRHLKHSTDEFVIAPGTKGMVMVVFTLPSFRYVFKVIRDWFDPPKTSDASHVRRQYVFVKHHDRVGRMADTLEFSNVAFPRARIGAELLRELERLAPSTLEVTDDLVVVRHLYVERRMTPLDVFVQAADETRLRAAIQSYGDALKELAAADIFAGDLLPKNFGVTRNGRVVFYDYDEIAPLTDCRFRRLPTARHDDEETAGEPWFSVAEHDIFPEQFATFLFPEGRARELFLELHGDLLDPAFWVGRQERLRAGIIEDVFPYPQEVRFPRRFAAPA